MFGVELAVGICCQLPVATFAAFDIIGCCELRQAPLKEELSFEIKCYILPGTMPFVRMYEMNWSGISASTSFAKRACAIAMLPEELRNSLRKRHISRLRLSQMLATLPKRHKLHNVALCGNTTRVSQAFNVAIEHVHLCKVG